MKLVWFPQHLNPDASAKVQDFIDKELVRHKDLLLKVKRFLEQIEGVDDLKHLYATKQMLPLGEGLHEMRIPRERPGGVVRIYFCHDPFISQWVVLLDAELKKQTTSECATARKRMSDYLAYRQKEMKNEQKRR